MRFVTKVKARGGGSVVGNASADASAGGCVAIVSDVDDVPFVKVS